MSSHPRDRSFAILTKPEDRYIALRKWVRTFEIAEALIFKDFFLLPSALEPSAFCYNTLAVAITDLEIKFLEDANVAIAFPVTA